MMKKYLFILIACLSVLMGCTEKKQDAKQQDTTSAEVVAEVKDDAPGTILENFSEWWQYNSRYIQLYKDFVALDTDSTVISKDQFFKTLAEGKTIPFSLTSKATPHYMLYKIKPSALKDFYGTVKQWGGNQYHYFKMEGKPLPPYQFKDLNGKEYTPSYMKGKVVAIKCWFISCKPCVAEIPALNKLVEQYKDRQDLLFLGLAIDKKAELQHFLSKVPFNYNVIPEQGVYMDKKLGIFGYPTHVVLDRNSNVLKVVDNEVELAYVLTHALANQPL